MPSEFFLNPLELFVLGLLACIALMHWWRDFADLAFPPAFLPAAAGAAIAGYLAILIYYLATPGVFDHGEVLVPAWSWAFASGHPLYNRFDDAARYSTLYGPMGNLFYAWAMDLLGPGIFACKLTAALAGAGSCALVWATCAKEGDRRRAWFGAGAAAILFLAFAFQSFMTKHDPFLLFFAALALCAAVSLRAGAAGVVIAVSLGVVVNLKVHGALYVIPALVLYARESPLQRIAAVGAGAAIVVILPFLHPRISFAAWFEALCVEGDLGLGRAETMANVQWFGFLWLPFAALFFIAQRRQPAHFAAAWTRHRLYLLALFGCMLLTGIVGSKVASGPAHFVPFLPLLIYGFCLFLDPELRERREPLELPDAAAHAALVAFAAAALFLAAHQQYRFLTTMSVVNRNTTQVTADLAAVVKALPGKSISMGYGSSQTFFLSQQMLPLVFANQPYYFNSSAMMGFHDHFLSAASHEVISGKHVDVWLIPRGDTPFTIRSFYQPNPELFDTAFREAFAAAYQRVGNSSFYDIYAAKSP